MADFDVGALVARLKLDNSDFNRTLAQSRTALQGVGSAVDKTSTSVKAAQGHTNTLGKSFATATDGANKTTASVNKLGSTLGSLSSKLSPISNLLSSMFSTAQGVVDRIGSMGGPGGSPGSPSGNNGLDLGDLYTADAANRAFRLRSARSASQRANAGVRAAEAALQANPGNIQLANDLAGAATRAGMAREALVGAEAAAGRLSTALAGVSTAAAAVAAALVAVAAAMALVIAQSLNMASAMADDVEKLNNMAASTGISVEKLQEMRVIATEAGMSFDTLVTGAEKLVKVLGEGGEAGTAATRALERLGVQTKDAAGNFRDSGDIYWETITALQGMENSTERNATAAQIFGRSWAEVAPLLAMSREELEEIAVRAHESGAILSAEQIAAASRVDALKDKLATLVEGMRTQWAAAFLPILEWLMSKLEPAITFITQRIRDFGALIQHNFEVMRPGLERIWDAMVRVGQAIQRAYEAVEPLVERFGQFIQIMLESAVEVELEAIAQGLEFIADAIEDIVTTAREAFDAIIDMTNALRRMVGLAPISIGPSDASVDRQLRAVQRELGIAPGQRRSNTVLGPPSPSEEERRAAEEAAKKAKEAADAAIQEAARVAAEKARIHAAEADAATRSRIAQHKMVGDSYKAELGEAFARYETEMRQLDELAAKGEDVSRRRKAAEDEYRLAKKSAADEETKRQVDVAQKQLTSWHDGLKGVIDTWKEYATKVRQAREEQDRLYMSAIQFTSIRDIWKQGQIAGMKEEFALASNFSPISGSPVKGESKAEIHLAKMEKLMEDTFKLHEARLGRYGS